jgi:hypothetical protein
VVAGEGRCRLVVKFAVAPRRDPIGVVTRRLLPLGDLVMMRKQLLMRRELAEHDARGR